MNSSLILSFFFFFFSSAALFSALMVIISTNSVYSALFLILVFFNVGLLVLLLDLEFLALIFVLIYIGAIMVLVLFVIMMLDIKQVTPYLNLSYYFFISGFFLLILSSELLYFIYSDLTFYQSDTLPNYYNWFHLLVELSTIKSLGLYLYTYFAFFFLIAGLILLVAMIGAISLTLEDPAIAPETKHQDLFKQVNITPKDSIFYVKEY